MLSVIKNIKEHTKNLQMTILDYWGIKINDPLVRIYRGIEVLANGMVEKLPNILVLAQNIGLRQGEIVELGFHLEALMLLGILVQLSKKSGKFLDFIEIKR